MNYKSSPPLLARILLGVTALLTVGVVYWFLSKTLESLPTPSVPPPRQAKSFNPRADVAKNPAWPLLEATYLTGLPDMPLGRGNPFVPVQATSSSSVPPGGLQVPGSKIKIVPAPASTSTALPTSTPAL